MQQRLVLPVRFDLYRHPVFLNSDGEELGLATSESPIPEPEMHKLRASFLGVMTTHELSEWLNAAHYITTTRASWGAGDVTESLQKRFFDLRDVLNEWMGGVDAPGLLQRFPSQLVDEVTWTTSAASGEAATRASIIEDPITGSYIKLPILTPRQALILSAHVDLFWNRLTFGRCQKCGAAFVITREDKRFCSKRCKKRAASMRYYHKP